MIYEQENPGSVEFRAKGKVVVGLGISGASAEYLINACDQFIFYDLLVGAPQQRVETGAVGETATTACSSWCSASA